MNIKPLHHRKLPRGLLLIVAIFPACAQVDSLQRVAVPASPAIEGQLYAPQASAYHRHDTMREADALVLGLPHIQPVLHQEPSVEIGLAQEIVQVPAPERRDGGPATADAEGLTLAELEQIAVQNNPTLRQARSLIEQARGNLLQAGLYPNPTVGYVGSEIGNEGNAGQQGFFVNQDVVTASKLQRNRAVFSWDVQRAQLQADAQQQRVLNGVRMQYYELLAAQRLVGAATDLERIARQGVEVAEQLLEAQEAPQTDVLQARVELNSVQLLLRNARQGEQAARRQLATTLGIPELPPSPAAGDLEQDVRHIEYEAEWQRLQAMSPVLQVARAQIQRARAQLQREQVQSIPDLQLEGSVQQDLGTDDTIVGVQVGVTLPVHNRNQGNIAVARAELHRVVDEVARLELTLRQQLAASYRSYDVARSQVEAYHDSILPMAKETLELITASYRAGEADFFRVLTARRTYFESYVGYIAALAELKQAATEIEGLLLTGGLGDPSELSTNPGGGVTSRLTIIPQSNSIREITGPD